MQGYDTLWLPGMDHAGIAVHALVERHLAETEGKGRFDYTSGKAMGAPACVNLNTYAMKVENGKAFIDIG